MVLLKCFFSSLHKNLELSHWEFERIYFLFRLSKLLLLFCKLLSELLLLLLDFHGSEGYFASFFSPFSDFLEKVLVLQGGDFFFNREWLLSLGLQLGIDLVDDSVFAVVANPLKFAFFSPPLSHMLITSYCVAKATWLQQNYHFFILVTSISVAQTEQLLF